jgi:hypothetical protein
MALTLHLAQQALTVARSAVMTVTIARIALTSAVVARPEMEAIKDGAQARIATMVPVPVVTLVRMEITAR